MFHGIHELVGDLERTIARSRLLTWCYCRPYHTVVRNELALAGVGPRDTILIVGCGSVPFTALLAALYSEARVVAVDRDPNAVAWARRVAARSRWSDRISVRLANGPTLQPDEASVVFLALQLTPKDETLECLSVRCRPGTRIVARVPRSQYEDIYGTYSRSFCPIDRVPQSMKSFDASVLYVSDDLAAYAKAT